MKKIRLTIILLLSLSITACQYPDHGSKITEGVSNSKINDADHNSTINIADQKNDSQAEKPVTQQADDLPTTHQSLIENTNIGYNYIPTLTSEGRYYIYRGSDDPKEYEDVWATGGNIMPASAAKDNIVNVRNVSSSSDQGTAIRIRLNLAESPYWAGVAIPVRVGYFGKEPGNGINLTGAKKLIFYAKGSRGGEEIQIKAFTSYHKYGDSADIPLSKNFILTQEWTKYKIDIDQNENLKRVISTYVKLI